MLSHGWFSPCFLLDGLTFLYSILFSPLTWKSYIQLWGNVVLKIVGSEANCLSSSTAPPVLGYGTGTRVHLAMCICGPLLASYKVAIFASWVLAIMPMMFPLQLLRWLLALAIMTTSWCYGCGELQHSSWDGFLNGSSSLARRSFLILQPWLTPASSYLPRIILGVIHIFKVHWESPFDSTVWLCIYLVLNAHVLYYMGMFWSGTGKFKLAQLRPPYLKFIGSF